MKKPTKKKFKNQRFDFVEQKETTDDDELNADDTEAVSEYSFNSNSDEWLFEKSFRNETNSIKLEDDYNNDYEEEIDEFNDGLENDDDELRDQLDMHSMILAKSEYHDENDSLITAEQVLSEIETLMTLQVDFS